MSKSQKKIGSSRFDKSLNTRLDSRTKIACELKLGFMIVERVDNPGACTS